MNLAGKTALITGSTSGIGLGLATAISAQGANVVLNGISESQKAQSAVNTVKDAGGNASYKRADVSKPEDIKALVDHATQTFGGIDILINNAGIQHVEDITTFPDHKWEAIISINLSAAFYTIKHCVPLMKEAGWGRIINIASVHGLVASPYKSAYIAAKHGLIGLTKDVGLELAGDNITANAICPGYVDTPLVRKQIPDQAREHNLSEEDVIEKVLLKQHAIKDFVTAEQLGALAVFLCSDAASTLTSTALPVDGGWTAH